MPHDQPQDNSFGKERRVLRTREFDAVFQHGRVVRDRLLSVYNRPNGLGYSRLGLVVSRKVGIAVRRNRVKRLIREAFRLNPHRWPRGFDLLVVPAPGYPGDSLQEVEQRLLNLLSRLPREAPAARADGPEARRGVAGPGPTEGGG